MLIIPVGRLYIALQKKKGNPKFQDPVYQHKFEVIISVVGACVAGVTIYILYFILN
ncbi:hypothetical protein [uncultured Muribaculum sp.]|uniref:hypothetical protein n=1 Tax=uncultured Muribaculum sp. TaxID=1918613 RepID=UPI0026134B63|nr:hypothetical protein [uncultured Muribaculum sp.]